MYTFSLDQILGKKMLRNENKHKLKQTPKVDKHNHQTLHKPKSKQVAKLKLTLNLFKTKKRVDHPKATEKCISLCVYHILPKTC